MTMTESMRPTPAEIRAYRAENPKLRERDIAAQLGISEAALVAAECGLTAIRIESSANRFLERAEELGEVLALTRNESAVHEKVGLYENVKQGHAATLVLGSEIDLRVFPGAWEHGFAVTKTDAKGEVRRSLQFFDKWGNAVHKVHLRPASHLAAYEKLVEDLRLDDQSQDFIADPGAPANDDVTDDSVDTAELRDRWSKLTDTHQFPGMLRKLKVGRRRALHSIGDDFAWRLDTASVETMMRSAAETALPIMCFVGNRGVIQIHSGPVVKIGTMGPWLNVMDETFHLHLRTDHITELWAVRKPTADGHVTSVEGLDAKGEMIIQFFGKRKEGSSERAEWRSLAEGLPRLKTVVAA
ncbi:hemin-degrading factor [Sinorhizobium medicae]|uniref:Haemin-degrading family protein n=3 Tax=Sinorhizobium medicae TaxID=110321 RepID=A6UBZ0_SINMW|nr:Haemin-degrading family protein [Sinorhizobium medicae WSM419]MDX0405659.1 hemin-degrading factor [Sinorhizobium medicae]MDX0411179.1 hemin-degrading factor [Sinorhizobium medicae]MDX0417633.1 hemin-degrading factor [Sinorhizobium medicae]MDX0437763.1 hemin-degrading factor [Sinorhizobium medicae]